jgi:hypothetical protein
MLDFKGRTPGSMVSGEAMQEAMETLDFKNALSKLGALPDQVAAWCESRHLLVTDRGMGGDRWHMGIPFEDPLLGLSTMLAAEKQFEYALRKGWLSLHLMSWGKLDGPDLPASGHGISAPPIKTE